MKGNPYQHLCDENNHLKQKVEKLDKEIARLKQLTRAGLVDELSQKNALLETEFEKSEKRVRDLAQENLRLQRRIAELQSGG